MENERKKNAEPGAPPPNGESAPVAAAPVQRPADKEDAVGPKDAQQSGVVLDFSELEALRQRLHIIDGDMLVDKAERPIMKFEAAQVERLRKGAEDNPANAKGQLDLLTLALRRTELNRKFCQLKMERLMDLLSRIKREEELVDDLLKISAAFDAKQYAQANDLLNAVFARLEVR